MTSDAEPPSTAKPPQAPARGLPLHKRFLYSGVVILFAGLIGAALTYVFSAEDATGGPVTEIGDRRANEFQIERIGGKATVYVVRFNEWLGSLWQGRQLASTVGVLSIVIALACFWVAGLVSARSPGDQDEDRKG